jgi:hypothetical protein
MPAPKQKPNERVEATIVLRDGATIDASGDLYVKPGTPDKVVAEYLREQADYNPDRPLDVRDVHISRRKI